MWLVERVRFVVMAVAGVRSQGIARRLRVSRPTVQLWRECFLVLRLAGMENDAARPWRLPRIPAEWVRAVVEATLRRKPANAMYWGTRTMAQA